jgi:hypothetical protein
MTEKGSLLKHKIDEQLLWELFAFVATELGANCFSFSTAPIGGQGRYLGSALLHALPSQSNDLQRGIS